jgi:hypothetical protein
MKDFDNDLAFVFLVLSVLIMVTILAITGNSDVAALY